MPPPPPPILSLAASLRQAHTRSRASAGTVGEKVSSSDSSRNVTMDRMMAECVSAHSGGRPQSAWKSVQPNAQLSEVAVGREPRTSSGDRYIAVPSRRSSS
eukprot:3887424-Pleurochrysis_carterae.AAC.1